ncbi:hypothetical protein AAFP30_19255 [Gordonia sp. CPCC 205515]|uniref:LppU/SCO3897 family protein n=1 Tax=Gordonia sp. CPCC 205515 TaxID=3140791 RepID=UPI003AF3AC4A
MTTPPGPPPPDAPHPGPPEGWQPSVPPYPGQQGQPFPPPEQPYPGQPGPGQPGPGQPNDGQPPYAGPAYGGQPPYPGGQQSYPGAQQPYPGAQQPYPGAQQYPGQYGQYPMGSYPPPPRKKSLLWLWITLGVVAVVGIAFIGLVAFGVFATRDVVTDNDDVAVGECVHVTGTGSSGLTATKTDCSSEEFTFYVASKIGNGAGCPSDDYSQLTWSENGQAGREQLCLVPNLVTDKCYQIPGGGTAHFEDFKVVDCASTGAAGTQVVRVVTRTDGQPSCVAGQYQAFFELPRPIGYCFVDSGAA